MFEMIIGDEIIKIKSPKAQQTKAVKQLPAKYRIALSGYPIANRIIDIWSQVDWVQPGYLGTFWNFCDNYTCIPEGTNVFTDKGNIKIEKLKNNKNKKILTLDIKNGNLSWNVQKAFWEKYNNELIEIKTNKRKLKLTPEHLIYIKGEGWIKAKNIILGQEVLIMTEEK